ncbi:MAG: Ig-like domain-containing protein [Haliea sp.]|nr:Ig-like domain-containing protein [Haliea sp.]
MSVADGLGGVPTNVKLNVRFSEAINVASITDLNLRDGLNNVVPTSLTFSSAVDLLTLNLSGPLSPSASYRLDIGGIVDTVGNPLAAPQAIDFTTGLVGTPPAAISSNGVLQPIRHWHWMRYCGWCWMSVWILLRSMRPDFIYGMKRSMPLYRVLLASLRMASP